jgi:hypothetical protein
MSCRDKEKCSSCCSCKGKCGMLYLVGAWADDYVISIRLLPKNGIPIEWSVANGTLNISNPTNGRWNMQAPVFQQQFQFPMFPLKVCCGDKIEFVYGNYNSPAPTHNAIAAMANIDGTIYRTFNSTTVCPKNRIVLRPECGRSIVDPEYQPNVDVPTFVGTENFIAVTPNDSSFILTWTIELCHNHLTN